MNREATELWSAALGAAGTVIRYGHWGRPVLVFPSERGRAWDFENNGMVGAVQDLIDAGRVKLYCVDSYDAASWSNHEVPLEERARRHGRYESWIVGDVVPWIYHDSGGHADVITLGCSLGAFHAANFALKRADLFPLAMCFSGNYDPASWNGWGERGNEAYFNNPLDYVAHLHGDHLDWLRGQLSACCWSAGRASGRTPRARWRAPAGSPRCSPTRASSTNSTCGGMTSRTTGLPGAPSWPTTCRDSADDWRQPLTRHTDRAAARHRGRLAHGVRGDPAPARARSTGRAAPHAFDVERITIEPFSLRDQPRYDLVIDRLAYWYYHPREWLKKVALMDGVYLLNSPFTFQSMEKHAAYCAMMRLGLKVPETVLVPYKNPLDNARYAYTAARYNQPFDLDAIAQKIGYPLFMKPYDGGAWRGVSRINNADELHAAYDASGEMLMHLQKAIDYDVFARSLSIGAETMVMKFQPDQPMHLRYAVEHDFLAPDAGLEVVTIGQAGQRVLPVGVQLLRDPGQGRRGLPHRLRQRLPRRRPDQPALLLPLGDEGPGQVDRLRAGDGPPGPARPGDRPATSPSPTSPACRTGRSWASTASWPTPTSTPSATRTSAPPAWPGSTSSCWTG